MPDSAPVAAPPPRPWLRPVGAILVVLGGIGLLVSAFLHWFTVSTKLPNVAAVAGLPSELSAHISGLGGVTMPTLGDQDVSSSVPTNAAWAGWSVIVLGLGAIIAGGLLLFGPPKYRRYAGPALAVCGLLATVIAVYALFAPVGTETVRVQGFPLQMHTTAAAGPYLALIAAVLVAIGAGFILIGGRSAARSATVATPAATPTAPAVGSTALPARAPRGAEPQIAAARRTEPAFDPRRPGPPPQRGPQQGAAGMRPVPQRRTTQATPPPPAPPTVRTPAPAGGPSGPPVSLSAAPTRAFATPHAPRISAPDAPENRSLPPAHDPGQERAAAPRATPPSQRDTTVVRRPTPPTRVAPRPQPADADVVRRLEGPTGPL